MPLPRARKLHEKKARRQDILAAAARLFERSGFAALTMAQVAHSVGLAKGTLYLYFQTKEELFLALAEEALLAWFEGLDEAFSEAEPGSMTVVQISDRMASDLADQPLLSRLLPFLHPVLEHNVDRLAALNFRELLATRLGRTGRYLERLVPGLKEGEGAPCMMQAYQVILGAAQLGNPSPVVTELLDAPGLHVFQGGFQTLASAGIARVLRVETPVQQSEEKPLKAKKAKVEAVEKPVKAPKPNPEAPPSLFDF